MTYSAQTFNDQLKKTEHWLDDEFGNLNTGRANPALLDSIKIEAYGSEQPIKNVASVSLEDARTLRVVPWDKSQIADIEKVIRNSNLPFSPSVDDAGLRLVVPVMTDENKQSVVKLLKDKLEQARVSVRKERDTAIKEIEAQKKSGELSEDDVFRMKEDIQKAVDATNKVLEERFVKKEKDVMNA